MPIDAESDPNLVGSRLTARLAAFVAETPASKLPATTIESSKQLILDTIGVALAASSRPIGKVITQHVKKAGALPAVASVIGGGGVRVATPWAALANGTLANALDFDGGHHIPTHMLPAALAVAEEHGLSGQDLLTAFVLGFEATAKLTHAVDAQRKNNRGPTQRGWWHVGLIGPVSAAMTVGRLLKLDKDAMATAIGISTASSAGFRRSMGTMTKSLHSGNAARGGIDAVQLAQLGFTGDKEIIEGPLGFMHAMCLADERDAKEIDHLGHPFALEKAPGVKDYPAVTPSHAVIDATLAIRRRDKISADDVDSVEADFHTFSLLRDEATDEESAGFCAPFLIAAALIHGAVGLEQMTEEAIHDPKIKALMKRIKNVPTVGKVDKVVIRLKDKRVLTAEAEAGRRVTSVDVVEKKFRYCAGLALKPAAVTELISLVMSLDKQPSIARIMALASGRA